MTSSEAIHPTPGSRYRRPGVIIGVVVALAFSYGLQMYASVPAFGSIGDSFNLTLSQISLLVSAFFLGYAAAHIPAGFAAAAWGFKTVAVSGSALLTASTALFAVSNHFALLLISRFVGGMAMSMIVGSAIPIAAGWSRPDRVRITVGGFVNGLGFTVGAALALYAWTYINSGLGWRAGAWIAAVIALVITLLAAVFLVTPTNIEHEEFSWNSTMRCFRSKSMWMIGIGSIGAYGGLFTVSQLGPGYAEAELGLSASSAGLLSAMMLFLGIPGALFGGYIADRARRFVPTLRIPAFLMVVCIFALPFAGPVVFSLALACIGFLGMMYFAPCTVSPGEYPDEISPRDYGTALGLVLTLGNVGAIVFPYLYGNLSERTGTVTGWLALASVAAVACCALFVTREPRTTPSDSLAPSQVTLV
ncbi:putative sulfoacetate transporter SauU [Rhodococcus ruber]|uniref:MFS transporter n=1 Tax=Rhodococcus ruber TaxID=1830 RepID=UPI00315C994D